MTRHTRLLSITVLGVLALLAGAMLDATPVLVWNVTASAPFGLYLMLPARRLRVGDLVLLRLDPSLTALFESRGYLPRGVPLLKRVAALSGTLVCVRDGAVFVADRRVADILPSDASGRQLTAWTGCHQLADGKIFVLNLVPDSLDGRYFGPSPMRAVIGRAVPLWTHEAR
jgi:conjugative transfer signal peptidase TraF